MIRHYGGWEVFECKSGPETGRFVAWRSGVRIGHPQIGGLIRMIVTRNRLERERANGH